MQGLVWCGPGSQYPRAGSVRMLRARATTGRSIILPSSLTAPVMSPTATTLRAPAASALGAVRGDTR